MVGPISLKIAIEIKWTYGWAILYTFLDCTPPSHLEFLLVCLKYNVNLCKGISENGDISAISLRGTSSGKAACFKCGFAFISVI